MSDPFIGPPDCIIEGSVTASNQGSEIISKGPARFQASSYKLTIRELGKATQEKFSGMVPISRRKEVVAFICDREERNECIEGPHRSRCRLLQIHQRAAATIMQRRRLNRTPSHDERFIQRQRDPFQLCTKRT